MLTAAHSSGTMIKIIGAVSAVIWKIVPKKISANRKAAHIAVNRTTCFALKGMHTRNKIISIVKPVTMTATVDTCSSERPM